MASLNWIGKEAVVNHDQEVPFKLLEEVSKPSHGKGEQNLLIQGDNLEALKALIPAYQGAIKCIYIDPPYNTGHEDWIYNDNVNSPKIREWLGRVVKGEAEDLTRHDKWLCMMYPRLKLLRDLLKDDGVIFVSIDDNEVHNLRFLLDDIFGVENFIEMFSWVKTETPSNLSNKTKKNTEYILCYEKKRNKKRFNGIRRDSKSSNGLLNQTNAIKTLIFPAGVVKTGLKDRVVAAGEYGTARYSVELLRETEIRNGVFIKPIELKAKFKWQQSKLEEEILAGTEISIATGTFSPSYEKKEYKPEVPSNLIDANDGVGTNEEASATLMELGFSSSDFQYPKPVSLIAYLINMVTEPGDYVLDSFAGSGTTGHAVMELNEDGGERKFILIEMDPEVAKKVTSERLKRVIEMNKYPTGFTYCDLGNPLFDNKGDIYEKCTYDELALYIYFTETLTNLDKKSIINPFVGEKDGVSYYLLYKGKNKNDLTRDILAKIKGDNVIVYADRCLVSEVELQKSHVTFKQIPYNVKLF